MSVSRIVRLEAAYRMRFPISALSALAFFIHPGSMDVLLASVLVRGNIDRPSRDMPERVAIIDEEGEDGRHTEEEYASKNGMPLAQVQSRFAATGIIKCGIYTASAQLTGSSNTITTAAHVLSGEDNCDPGTSPRSCSFTTRNGSDVQTQSISELVATGFKCPSKPRMADDWAVLKLQNPIRWVRPYGLPTLNDDINPGDTVISVSGSSVDFQRLAKHSSRTTFPKSIEECQTKKPYLTLGVITLFESTCDFSGGNSGGSILRASQSGDVLLGISKANDETLRDRANARKSNIVKRGKYSEGKWATYHVPVAGDFLKAIYRANSATAE